MISGHRLRLDRLSGWRLAENEADAAYQAANGFARNALRALPPARYLLIACKGKENIKCLGQYDSDNYELGLVPLMTKHLGRILSVLANHVTEYHGILVRIVI